jgi:NADPH2:quinone reductase
MPRAIIGHTFGPPESYRLEAFDPGSPGAGEIRVEAEAMTRRPRCLPTSTAA